MENDATPLTNDENALAGDTARRTSLSRRAFIGTTIAAGASVLLVPEALHAFGTDPVCTPTSRDLYGLGPFHEDNAPFRVALAGTGEPGRRVTITGLVTARDCTTPMRDVVVDVWGANDAGCYTQIDANGNLTDTCTPRAGDPYNLRGRLLTGADGTYSFTTIIPGRYLNGNQYRPSHLHFIITPPGGTGLITQLYFEGDPFLTVDAGSSDPNAASRIIPLASDAEGLAGRFDIILNVNPPASAESSVEFSLHDTLEIAGANPAHDETAFDYSVARTAPADIMIFDALGRHVRTLVDAMHGAGRYHERWDLRDTSGNRVAAGVYIGRLRTDASAVTVSVIVQ